MFNFKQASRKAATEWLVANIDEWPDVWSADLFSGVEGWDWAGSQKGNVIFVTIAMYSEITKADWLAAQSKNDTPVWNALTSSPPVGWKGEAMDSQGNWLKGEVLFSSDYVVVWGFSVGQEGSVKAQVALNGSLLGNRAFRPIVSDADRQRDAAIAELAAFRLPGGYPLSSALNYEDVAALIDAGYRKPEKSHDTNC